MVPPPADIAAIVRDAMATSVAGDFPISEEEHRRLMQVQYIIRDSGLEPELEERSPDDGTETAAASAECQEMAAEEAEPEA